MFVYYCKKTTTNEQTKASSSLSVFTASTTSQQKPSFQLQCIAVAYFGNQAVAQIRGENLVSFSRLLLPCWLNLRNKCLLHHRAMRT